jgi:peptidoglycan/xylan/chitin deacetylase (PgdA/CDA1 family)
MGKLIVTTSWDDGSTFDLKIVELLNKYGIKGTFYIPKSLFAHPLKKQDIIAIDENFEIGSHGLTHADLTKISLSEAKKEIEGSKAYLENLLGHRVYMFSYPDGKYNENIKRIVKKSGFIAARTSNPGNFDLPSNPFEWHITTYASNGSPLTALKIWLKNYLPIKALSDWEVRAKLLFDIALEKGGIYHIWGHSLWFEMNLQWDKLERVLRYISNRKDVSYMTNGEIFRFVYQGVSKFYE